MSASGRSGDAYTTAAHYRANTENAAAKWRKDHHGLNEDGLLAYTTLTETERHQARIGVCDLAITAGCEQGPGQPCPSPDHAAHVNGVLRAFYILGLLEDPGRGDYLDEWGRRKPAERHKTRPAA